MGDELDDLVRELRAALDAGDTRAVTDLLRAVHPTDAAEAVSELEPDQRVRVLLAATEEKRAEVLPELEFADQVRVIETLAKEDRAALLRRMSDDDIADLLAEMPAAKQALYLSLLGRRGRDAVRRLLAHGEHTAGGIMTTEFVALPEDMAVEEATNTVRRTAETAETIYYLYVVDRTRRLVGVLTFRDLLLTPAGKALAEIMDRNVIKVGVEADQEEAARLVSRYGLLALPVVDTEGRLVGIVTYDDVLDVIEDEATEDIYRLAAYSPSEESEFHLGIWARSAKRLWWLLALLFGELAAGSVIHVFGGLLQALAILALFIPVMSGEAGNAATQSLAVVVRGLATREIERADIWRVVGQELRIGLVAGAVSGTALALFALALQRSPVMGLVVGAALALNITVAAMLGGFFPIILQILGFDPAVASGPLITTLTDIISMAIYFGLAAVVAAFGLLGRVT